MENILYLYYFVGFLWFVFFLYGYLVCRYTSLEPTKDETAITAKLLLLTPLWPIIAGRWIFHILMSFVVNLVDDARSKDAKEKTTYV